MRRLLRLFQSSIGAKLMMALSGVALVLFMLGHMLGNLTVYQGPGSINAYAAWLQGHPLLWLIRLVMAGILILHAREGVRLALANRRARPLGYRLDRSMRRRFAERHMLLSGLAILLFLLFHLAHLTLDWMFPAQAGLVDTAARADVYCKLVSGFRIPWVVLIYLAGLGFLWLHLHHGIQSIFQTLGFNHQTYQGLVVLGGIVLGAVIVLGLASIPLAVLAGFIGGGACL